jgi:Na+/proline symporter
VPLYNKLKVFTAYEFLEQRFDIKTRVFTSSLFLLSRALSTGISIYAPSIILSSLMGWDIFYTNLVMGGLLIIYTVSGGAKAVAYTQQLQLLIIFGGMFAAGYFIVHHLPEGVGFSEALEVSGATGKLNVITTGITDNGFDWKDRYNIISGVIGGFFLALSYFGTDQSQVGRYLTAKDTTESRLGLLMNGLVKVPMQFAILLLGALLFTFYQFKPAPIFFNSAIENTAYKTSYKDSLREVKNTFNDKLLTQQAHAKLFVLHHQQKYKDSVAIVSKELDGMKKNYKTIIAKAVPGADTNDTNYIFLRFVVDQLPRGLVGLLIAIIFLAAWGSIAAALNSLASCTMIDFHKRFQQKTVSEKQEYRVSKYYTLGWGIFCIITAELAGGMGSLIEAVNVLGSLFYGVILGIFLVAFYWKKIGANAVFWAAVIGELAVITLFALDKMEIIGLGFLWLNVAGALIVVLLSYCFAFLQKE